MATKAMRNSEINEAVARKLGWVEAPKGNPYSYNWKPPEGNKRYNPYTLPDFCHSIEAAWEIIHWLHQDTHGSCVVELTTGLSFAKCRIGNCADWFEAKADTAPMTICLAFLKLP